ncbi:MAG: aspartate--ammonia ligase [Bacteroidales bacterium]|jgi:aspartate--ammonia ligase|nr:aspartate--ammonia ligase [Bacteroidales bacterium]
MLKTEKTHQTIFDRITTENSVFELKDFFKRSLAQKLNLMEVFAPMVVTSGTGINDDLNGVEKPVSFIAKSYPDRRLEIVQSLAKWKRLKLGELDIPIGSGIVTDMKALRPDEIISPIHSIFVDQWDWEKRISDKERNLDYLKSVVVQIYKSIKETEEYINRLYPAIKKVLPDEITFIHSEELQYRYPKLTPKEREKIIAKDYGAVFIIGIGRELTDGVPHDLRAPDYDDWTSQTTGNYKGLNGDIIIWNPVLENAFEISSMGIRVDKKSLKHQLELTKNENRLELSFHKKLMNDELPLSIGGGIGQSRLAMLLLKKKHISDVQAKIS